MSHTSQLFNSKSTYTPLQNVLFHKNYFFHLYIVHKLKHIHNIQAQIHLQHRSHKIYHNIDQYYLNTCWLLVWKWSSNRDAHIKQFGAWNVTNNRVKIFSKRYPSNLSFLLALVHSNSTILLPSFYLRDFISIFMLTKDIIIIIIIFVVIIIYPSGSWVISNYNSLAL